MAIRDHFAQWMHQHGRPNRPARILNRMTCTVPELVAHAVSCDFPVCVEDHQYVGSAGVLDDDPAGQCSRIAGS
ncbi:hypothetical protein [Paractinoplanes hotanensis]|uniref:Uncharacterized protein n=1 Tax=Paractinoplanes hotanensis TaxID=2906497 RepID=A0ABT0YBJ0_9ACTN|nr:hypothetical protein [Actinoplanes hotanensis]MCM4083411.1 hypothetical protein [Actinoplanes hotanensis]